jgi:putative FmdB family regulatory protein
MPTYTYRCASCGTVFDKWNSIAMRQTTTCSCGATAEQDVLAAIPFVTTPPEWFKPGYDEGLGEHIHSKEERKRVMQEKGAAEL